MRPAPWIVRRRAKAAVAAIPARPAPPAKTGLLKRPSRAEKDDGGMVDGSGIVWHGSRKC